MSGPYGLAFDSLTSRLFVAQSTSNRVTVYNVAPESILTTSTPATHVLGQINFTSSTAATTQSGFSSPRGIAYDTTNDRLFVVQDSNMRVSIFDASVDTISNGMNAIDLLGQYNETEEDVFVPNYTKSGRNNGPNILGLHSPSYTALDTVNHRLFISDTTNNRILVHSLDSGDNLIDYEADYVIGQVDFDTRVAATSQSGLSGPQGVAYDDVYDRLFVTDSGNNRVLVYDVSIISNGMNASYVLGQTLFTTTQAAVNQSGMFGPQGLEYDDVGEYLFVADGSGNRVLIFDVSPGTILNGMDAIDLLGQPNFFENTASVSQNGLSGPTDLAYDPDHNRLFVSQSSNRVSVFDLTISTSTIAYGPEAVGLLGQFSDDGAGNLTPYYNRGGRNNGPTDLGFFSPEDVVIDPVHHLLFIAESSNNRVVAYQLDSSNELLDYHADYVLGQPNFDDYTSRTTQSGMSAPNGLTYDSLNGYLFVAQSGNHRVTVYDINNIANGMNASYVLGQTTFIGSSSANTQAGMSTPVSLAYATSTSRLFVGQTGNNRVSVYDFSTTTISNGMPANYVLGQLTFTASTGVTTQTSTRGPTGLAYDSVYNRLFVAQGGNANRVSVYDFSTTTISNGMPANYVLGQTTFTGSTAATTQSGLSAPSGIAYDSISNRLFVNDSSNRRVVVYDVASITNGENATYQLGQPNFTTSTFATTQSSTLGSGGLAYNETTGKLYVVQDSTNRVSIFNAATSTITNGMNATDLLGHFDYNDSDQLVPVYTRVGYNNGPTRIGFDFPYYTFLDTVNHRLFVSDDQNHRVLVHTLDSNNDLIDYEADYVLGQSNFNTKTQATTQSGMSAPQGLAYDYENDYLFVTDGGNNRVLVFDLSISITNGMSASYVLGQTTFTVGSSGSTQVGLVSPDGLVYDSNNSRLFVSNSNRVSIFDFSTTTISNGKPALHILGQALFTGNSSATTQVGFNNTDGLAYDLVSNRLFVSDTGNNRVKVYDFSTTTISNGMPANYVLGQILFTNGSALGTQAGLSSPAGLAYNPVHQRLFVGGAVVIVFDVATSTISNGMNAKYIFGAPDFDNGYSGISTSSLPSTRGVTYDVDNERLYVTQTTAHRISIFDASPANTTEVDFPSASYVLGQSTFTGSSAAATQSGLDDPQGLAYDAENQRLFVGDNDSDRVVVYDFSTTTISNGMNASYVLGQTDFTGAAGSASQSKFATPKGVTYDSNNDRLYVADNGNSRIMMFTLSEGSSLGVPSFVSFTAAAASIPFSWSPVSGATSYTVSSTATSPVTTAATNYTFSGLNPNTSYSFQVRANNLSTSSSYSSVFTTSTQPTLVISNVTSTNVGTSTATISWITNRPASSRILYGFITSLGVSTTEINTLTRVLDHEVSLTNLVPCTVYNYTPRAVAGSGDFTTSSKRTFATRGCQFSAPIISHEASVVSSSSGGSITFLESGNGVSLTVPTGFTSTTAAAFQLKRLEKDIVTTDGGLPAGKNIIGSLVFDFKAISDTSTIISTFDEPVEVTMTYDPSDLEGIDTTTLSIFRYTDDEWTQLSPCTVNTNAFTVTCDTPGFSLFALMGEEGDDEGGAGDTSPLNGGIPYIPPAPPSSVSQFTINQGALSTNSRLVSLHITSPNASMVAVSSDSTFTNGSFESLISPLWYTLPLGNGEKTVYIKLRTSEGGELILSDTITLTSNACPLTPERPYKTLSSSSVFYVTSDCTRRPIPNERTYFTYFSSWSDVGVVSLATLTSVPLDAFSFLPLGPLYRPTYGALIKTPGDPKVYVLINDTKYWVTDEIVFAKLNYRSDWIEDVDSRLLDAYNVGEEITRTDVHPAFTLIKYQNSPKVYRLEVDLTDATKLIKRWIVTEDAFKKLNFRGDRIIVIGESEVYEDGESLE